MGGGSSAPQDVEISIFDYKYQKERADLRKALMSSFLNNPKNKDIAEKISIMRKLVTQHAHICATAERETATAAAADSMPTSTQAAYRELDRLAALYETSTVLKSAQCRIGPVACPLGHYAGYVDKFSDIAPKDSAKAPKCNICDKGVENGYHCGYCEYNLCVPCSTVYCCNGHALKLWTHAESQHTCIVCQKQPITSGYRCVQCEDFDVCDYCTWKDGRKAVQQIILDRISGHLAYLEAHIHESETAYKTMHSHSKKVAMNAYPTTKHLYDFSVQIQDLRAIAKAEVRQTRITKAIEKLREILCDGKDFSRTALIESMVVDCFTMDELRRLRGLHLWYEEQRSAARRMGAQVACPLGHAAVPYEAGPPVYAVPGGPPPSLSAEQVHSTAVRSLRPKPTPSSDTACVCMVCDRLASPSGVHCLYCDYTLCSLCAVMYCGRGHRMSLWTEAAATDAVCALCKQSDLHAGYRCTTCAVDLCDRCSSRDGRARIRTDWDAEVRNLVHYMKRHRRESDIAMFYQWRHAHQVVSLGLLVDYVHELRTAKDQAEKQVAQKPLIDKIKALRAEICVHPHLCATAARELRTNENFVFPSRKKAAREVERLADVLRGMLALRQPDRRTAAGIACPLGHAMDALSTAATVALASPTPAAPAARTAATSPAGSARRGRLPLVSPTTPVATRVATLPAIGEESPRGPSREDGHRVAEEPRSHDVDDDRLRALKDTTAQARRQLEQAMNSIAMDFPGSPFGTQQMRTCSVCDTKDMAGGHVCSVCEYHLCADCSVIYCRMGHRTKIWTLHDAHHMACDVCKKAPITSGYRCVTCQVDICDMCTTQESRNAFLLWPKRELQRVLRLLENLQAESPAATDFLERLAQRDKSYERVMSRLCKILAEAQETYEIAQREVQAKVETTKAHKFGALRCREML